MKKHISIKAASCLDMMNAFKQKIHELDPGYIESAENINASDDYFTDAEMAAIDRNGSDEELAIAAIAYNYGISRNEAKQMYSTMDSNKIQECIDYYNDRDLPAKIRLERYNARKGVKSSCMAKNSHTINATSGYLSDAEMAAIDRSGSDDELAISAIAYNYGIPWREAKEMYSTMDEAKIQECIDYYNDRDLPVEVRLARYDARRGVNSATCVCGDPNCDGSCEAACGTADKEEVTAEEYIQGAGEFVDEAYVDEMMQYVADETASLDPPAVCTWHVDDDNLIFIVTGIEDDKIDEYTCPLVDLTGDIDTDINYVVDAINAGV